MIVQISLNEFGLGMAQESDEIDRQWFSTSRADVNAERIWRILAVDNWEIVSVCGNTVIIWKTFSDAE